MEISVCIPTYNRKDYLALTLNSIYSQELDDFEVVIVDDGSTDNTESFLKSLNLPNLRYFYQKNSGDAAARNKLIDLAQGKYLTFIDSDDLLVEGVLKKMLTKIKSYSDDVVVYGDYLRIDKDGEVFGKSKKKMYSGFVTRQLFQDIFMHSCGALFPKAIFDDKSIRFNTSLKVCSDYAMWLYLSTKYELICLGEPTFKRRRHDSNLSVPSSANRLCELEVLEQFHQKYGKELIPRSEAMRRLSEEEYRVAKAFRVENNIVKSQEYFLKSFKTSFNLKSILKFITLYFKSKRIT